MVQHWRLRSTRYQHTKCAGRRCNTFVSNCCTSDSRCGQCTGCGFGTRFVHAQLFAQNYSQQYAGHDARIDYGVAMAKRVSIVVDQYHCAGTSPRTNWPAEKNAHHLGFSIGHFGHRAHHCSLVPPVPRCKTSFPQPKVGCYLVTPPATVVCSFFVFLFVARSQHGSTVYSTSLAVYA